MAIAEMPREVRRFCELYIQGLRELLKKNPPKATPCSTCAFNPGTDQWKGFESTIWHLIQAAQNGRDFFCHRNLKKIKGEYQLDLAKMIPCANYQAIRNSPELDRILIDAAKGCKEEE